MPNLSTDALFILLKSLERAEKRNFKLYVTRNTASTDLKIIQLFDALDKMKDYDEEELLRKNESIQKQQLSNLKAHLYDQILSSLRVLKQHENIDLQIHEQLVVILEQQVQEQQVQALVQLALVACGLPSAPDADLQQSLGQPLTEDAALQRGDLLFWKGHVAMVVDAARLIHANGHTMSVAYEDTAACIARILAAEGKPVSHRRRITLPHE